MSSIEDFIDDEIFLRKMRVPTQILLTGFQLQMVRFSLQYALEHIDSDPDNDWLRKGYESAYMVVDGAKLANYNESLGIPDAL